MEGAIAAGHPLTAEAGARILSEGGNAVDACVAAAFVSWVAESPLTGPGGGGFLLVHRARDRVDALLDFFVSVPGRSFRGEVAPMARVEISFDGQTAQPFRVGAASCAVPGSVAGLAEAHRLFGRLPWDVLLEPAIDLAERGVRLTEAQAFLHEILDPVLRFDREARHLYGGDTCLVQGKSLRLGDLGETLRILAADGAAAFYRGELARMISETVRGDGGWITEADLASYRVLRRRPVRLGFAAHEVVSNPPPSSGGLLIAFALGVLDRLEGPAGRRNAAEASRLVEAMRQAGLARTGSFASGLYRGGLRRELLSERRLSDAAVAAAGAARPLPRPVDGLPSTTHISVVDERGNAASLSASTGCGSGVVVPGTGIHLNNMLGEEDLNPGGVAGTPGRRLTSMMAPSVVLRDGEPRLVIGSAGSERLRGAIVQTVVDVLRGRPLAETIDAPRVHLDGEKLHLEGGFDRHVAAQLGDAGYDLVRWRGRNLYFGGVAAVGVRPDGGLEAAGDPRRGGAGTVVT